MRPKILKRNKNIILFFLGPTRIDLSPTYSHSKWEIRDM